jgi:hypothetical protein
MHTSVLLKDICIFASVQLSMESQEGENGEGTKVNQMRTLQLEYLASLRSSVASD